MKRPRITKKFCTSSANHGKYQRVNAIVRNNVSKSEKVEIVQVEITKTVRQPFVKVFGKLLPLSPEEVNQLSITQTIIWL